MGNDSVSAGRAAGLRQHHNSAGVTICTACHLDARPALYTPVGENVLPSYYFTPDATHPDKPTDPGNANGEEDFAGITEGLDNDGDGLYDGDDPDIPTACICADLDGVPGPTDLNDFSVLANCFGLTGASAACLQAEFDCSDMNGDLVVDLNDFADFATWFDEVSTQTVPACAHP